MCSMHFTREPARRVPCCRVCDRPLTALDITEGADMHAGCAGWRIDQHNNQEKTR